MIAEMIINMIMLPERIPFEKTEALDTADGFGEAFKDYHEKWERHSFKVPSDDITVSGEYIINPDAKELNGRKKVAVVCHGQTVTRAGAIKYAKMFYDFGFNVVIFDERYFGETTGDYCTLGWKEPEDIKAVIRYAREVFGENCFLGVHGESMGAGSSLKALDTEKPDFVIADCPFSDVGLLIHDLSWQKAWILAPLAMKRARKIGIKRNGLDYTLVKPIESVSKADVPVCFFHGKTDNLINCKHSVMMYEALKNPLKEIHLMENTDHARSVFNYPKEYVEIMKSFIEKIEKLNL